MVLHEADREPLELGDLGAERAQGLASHRARLAGGEHDVGVELDGLRGQRRAQLGCGVGGRRFGIGLGDCRHEDEPGCAVTAAVDSGALGADRLASYRKLMREAEVAAARTDMRLRAGETRKAKTIAKAVKDYYRINPR